MPEDKPVSNSATGAQPEVEAARRQHVTALLLFLFTALAILMRVAITPDVMNLLGDYTSEGGALYQKIHVGTYAFLLLLPVALFSRPIFLRGQEIIAFRALIRYCVLIIALIAYLIGTGKAGASGIFIDTYLAAGFAGLILLAQNAEARRRIGNLVLGINTLSATIGIFEAVTRIRFLPYAEGEASFRPTGLAGHPLALGLICATSIAFIALTRWPPWVRVTAILLFYVAIALSGARLALLLASAELILLIVLLPWGLPRTAERKAKVGVLLLTLVAGGAMLAVLAASGFLDRFAGGVVDDNFFARTDIYKIFDYVTLRDILLGTDLGAILKIVNEQLNLPYIESTPVYLTFLLGAVVAVPFAIAVFWLFFRLLRRQPRAAWIGTFVFFATALSNNTLNTKTMVVTMVVVLILAYMSVVPHQQPSIGIRRSG
jgi:hypothetical protein